MGERFWVKSHFQTPERDTVTRTFLEKEFT